jgi:hypothetical protein
MSQPIDRTRLKAALATEEQRFIDDHPRSRALFAEAKASLFEGVPMNWMVRWAGAFPVFVAEASGARFRDVDGREYLRSRRSSSACAAARPSCCRPRSRSRWAASCSAASACPIGRSR